MRSFANQAYVFLCGLFVVGVVVQVFLAGLGIGGEGFGSHESFGWILHTAIVLIIIAAIVGPRTRWSIGASIGLMILVTVQISMITTETAVLVALHPTLALANLALAGYMYLRGRREQQAPLVAH